MKNNRRIKITAFMLVLCMMISMLPGNIIALTDDSAESAETEQAVTPVIEEESLADEILEPIIVSEDITKRGENEKHFLCDDGSYIAVSYPQAVHEQVDGEWVDIEYDVEKDGNGISPVDDTIKVKFANNTNSAKLVKLESGDYKISWTVEAENENGDITEKVKLSKDSKAALKTTKEITQENKEKIKNEAKYTKEEVKSLKKQTKEKIKKLELAKTANIEQNADVVSTNIIIEDHNREQIQSISFAQSNVEYVGAFGEGTTLRYVMSQGKINEEIVLESYNGFKSYSMVIDTDGLIPIKTENGRVNLTDENGETVVTIAAPYMYDAAEKHSCDVDVTVTQESKKEWRITYTPDSEWLADKDRVYPVVIDPTVTTEGYSSNYQYDAYVYKGQTTYSDDSEEFLYVGYYNDKQHVAYWGIDSLPEIDPNQTITGAGLHMRFLNGTSSLETIGIYSTFSSLDTSTLTWSSKPASNQFLDNQTSIPSNYWVKFASSSFGNIINNLYASDDQSINFAIKYVANTAKEDYNVFYSTDYSVASYRPYLSVRYTISFSDISDDVYYIRNKNSGKYLSVSSGNSVTQQSFGNTDNQRWRITEVGTHKYTIEPLSHSGMKLYNPESGGVVVQSDSGSSRSKWRFEQCNDSFFFISSMESPWLALDVNGASTASGAIVYAFAHHGDDNQRWKLVKVNTTYETESMNMGDSYNLRSLSSGSVASCTFLEGAGNVVYDDTSNMIIAKTPGTTVIRVVFDDNSTYQLTVNILQSQPLADGIYYIKNYFSEKYVDTANHDVSNGTSVNQWSKLNETYSQLWEVEYAGNGGYYIRPVDNTLLNMTALSNASGNNYEVKLSSSSTSKWAIVEYGNGLYNVVPLDYPDKALSVNSTGIDDGINIVAQNRVQGSSTQKWTFENFEIKRAVILIHGRDSNSDGCWGAGNSIVEGVNDDYRVEEGIDYTNVSTQAIITSTIDNDHEEGGNLAYQLMNSGYVPNVNLFVFNYPNQGLVFNNALLFEDYVNNLISSVRNSNSDLRKQVFSLNGDNYTFNIVGHSMGGLVARYYIENLEQNEHVEKLITIDTPHWGSGYADLGNFIPLNHYMCDHDLEAGSAMFDENQENEFDCGYCTVYNKTSTSLLDYQANRNTKYYAIAGVDFEVATINENDYHFEMPTTYTTFTQIEDFLKNQHAGLDMNVKNEGDNMVGFMSQIGWTEEGENGRPTKVIPMEKIFINIDTNGGNTELVNILHSKNQHRKDVMNQVYVYLQE